MIVSASASLIKLMFSSSKITSLSMIISFLSIVTTSPVSSSTKSSIHLRSTLAASFLPIAFLRDLSVVIESIKSLLKRDFGQKHPMQTITDAISKISKLPNGKQVTDMNYSKVFVTKPKVDK